jgi:hypothetical protein
MSVRPFKVFTAEKEARATLPLPRPRALRQALARLHSCPRAHAR